MCPCSGTLENHGSLLEDTARTILFNSIGEQREMASLPFALSSPSRRTHPRTSSLVLANQEAARGATPPRRLRRLPAALQLQPLPRAHPRRLLPTRNPGGRPSQCVGVLVCISGGALSPRPTRTDDDRRRVDSPQRPAPPGNGHAGGRPLGVQPSASPMRAQPRRG